MKSETTERYRDRTGGNAVINAATIQMVTGNDWGTGGCTTTCAVWQTAQSDCAPRWICSTCTMAVSVISAQQNKAMATQSA